MVAFFSSLDIKEHMNSLIPVSDPSPGAVWLQRTAIALFKAGMSSVPFAALAWDIASASLELLNEHAAKVFLDELAERVGKLEGSPELTPAAHTAAQQALLSISQDGNEEFARDLARCVEAIQASDEDPRLLMQMAASMAMMQSRHRLYLGAIWRMQFKQLSPREQQVLAEVRQFPAGTFPTPGTIEEPEHYDVMSFVNNLLDRHYPSIDVTADLIFMQSRGWITVPSVRLVTSEPEPWKECPTRLTQLGQTVLESLSDDPALVPSYSDLK